KPRIRFFLALALTGLFATVALAAGPGAVRKRAESSTLVAGTIDIEQDGTVSAHRIDQPEKLLPQVVGLLDRVVPRWRFEPVLIEGRPVRGRAKVHVRVVLDRMGEDTYQLRIGSVTFFDEQRGAKGEAIVIAGAMTPPKYPTDADMTGVQGTVYLVLKI